MAFKTSFISFKNLLRNYLSPRPWPIEWQKALNDSLKKHSEKLPLNLIVVVTKESDSYSELLFLLCSIGVLLGGLMGVLLEQLGFSKELSRIDLMFWPTLGFAFGATLFQFRRKYLRRLAYRAIRDRVSTRAKALFLDHLYKFNQRLALLYISEIEAEALFLSSPDIQLQLPQQGIQEALSELLKTYELRNPMKAIDKGLEQMTSLIRGGLTAPLSPELATSLSVVAHFIGATDRPKLDTVPILKGNKDMN